MTLWQKIVLGRQALRVWTQAEDDYRRGGKGLLTSKTLWLNVLGLGVSAAGVVPPRYGLPVLALLNMVVRVLTDQPITSLR